MQNKIKKRVTKEGFLVDGTQERKRSFQLSFVREEYDLCRSWNHKVLKTKRLLEAWARCSWTHTLLQPVKPNNTKTQTQSEIKSYESMLRELNQDQHYVLLTTHVHQDSNLLCINNQLETSNDYSTVPTVALLSFNKIKLISFKVFKSKGLEAMSPQPWNVYHMQELIDLQSWNSY